MNNKTAGTVAPIGTVFDIQRSALLDGPGIRTAVFVKGCPLRCIWCHNPESQRTRPEIMVYSERCVGCGKCVEVCSCGAHEIEAIGGTAKETFNDTGSDTAVNANANLTHTFNPKVCVACGKCAESCANDAIDLKGKNMTAEEVFEIVNKDAAFYEATGGGITVSGGEPLSDYNVEFVRDLLQMCHDEGINTCIETCGFVSEEVFASFFPLVDIFLFDYKATGSEKHKELTGVGSELILANLERAYTAGKDIVLRCPMVPGVNDTDEHLAAIANLDKRYPNLRGIEIMAYHNMGVAKHERLGTEALCDLPNTEQEVKDAWLAQLRELGCTKAVIS